jgi:hypothetical protein
MTPVDDASEKFDQLLRQVADLRIKLDDVMACHILDERRVLLLDYISQRLRQITEAANKAKEQPVKRRAVIRPPIDAPSA